MKEHPIPQDITNYRFHIVGSMTLKQFGEVTLGVIIGLLIYQTNLFALIKWPLIVLFVGGGFATAFVPFEERPISHWLTTFFKILYKPTQFFWRRAYNIPAPFLFKGNADQVVQLQDLDLTPARRQRIKEFISSTGLDSPVSEYSSEEKQQLANILSIFQTQQVMSVQSTHRTDAEKPNLTVRVRSMRQFEVEPEDTVHYTVNSLDNTEYDNSYVYEPETVHSSSVKRDTYLAVEQVAQTLEVPENIPIEVASVTPAEEIAAITHQQNITEDERAFIPAAAQQSQEHANTQAAQFNTQLPFPNKPTEPNRLVGMVLTPRDELVPGAIVEIQTSTGHVSRAVKTNALGQFSITTPLANGSYIVTVDKDGHTFKPLTIELTGKVLDPLEIRSS